MNIDEAKHIITRESDYERKIVVRNIILIIVLIIVILGLVIKYAMPQLKDYISGFSSDENLNSESFGAYYKFIVPAILLLSLINPIKNLIAVKNRRKHIEKVFELLSAGNECQIHGNHTKYLTVIALAKIKISLNPVHYLEIGINSKNYGLPLPENYVPDVVRVFSNVNTAYFQEVISELYDDSEIKEDYKTDLKPLNEFQTFAQKEFSTEIAQMERGRGKSKNMIYLQTIIAITFVGGFVYLSSTDASLFTNSNQLIFIIGGFLLFTFILGYGFKFYHQKTASAGGNYLDFKKAILSRLVAFVNPKFHYIEKTYIGIDELNHSNLFEDKNYSLSGGDQIIGHYNGVAFQSCNLTISYRPNFSNEKIPDDVVFSGNYFVARFPKKFNGNIIIHPKKGFFGSLKSNDIADYLKTSGDKIRLEDPEFQKQFEVYCDDQILARYILTPAFMERLKEINVRNKGEVYISINESNIVIATNRTNAISRAGSGIDMLYVKINMELLDDIYTELTEQLTVIDTLKLNDKIWRN